MEENKESEVINKSVVNSENISVDTNKIVENVKEHDTEEKNIEKMIEEILKKKNIFEKANNSEKAKKEENMSNVKYYFEKKENTYLKAFGLVGLMVVSGIIGGAISAYVIKANNEASNASVSTNTTNTTYKIESVENPVEAVAKVLSPSVVGIKVSYLTQSYWGISNASGQGSGIVYSTDGYIVTNYHVIESAVTSTNSTIYVYMEDGTEYEATLVGHDEVTDLAVIKIEATNLTPAEFGNSDSVKVGQLAVAIGNPLGLEFAGSVTAGYISGLNRNITVDGTSYNLIQTDAAINSGNSGGPLVDGSGTVIGINTAKISATGVEGIGFAIPINDALPIIEELIENKTIDRPYIGIGGVALTESVAKKNNLVEGIYIQQVVDASPAQLAGIKVGDIIVEANGTKVTSVTELNQVKYKCEIGDTMDIKIYRNKEYITLKIKLAATSSFE